MRSYDEFIFEDGFFEFFRLVKNSGYLAIVITNQQGIGKGLMTEGDLSAVHFRMQEGLKAETGYEFDDIYFCGDLAASGSLRRKPAPGMLLEAIRDHDIDTTRSFMIGDSESDMIAARGADVRGIFIGNAQVLSAHVTFPDLHTLYIHFKKLHGLDL